MKTPLPAARIAALFLASGLLAGTLPVEAAIMMYTDRAAFTAASTGLTILDFEGLAPAGSREDATGIAWPSGISFRDDADWLWVVDPAELPSRYDWGSGAILTGQANIQTGIPGYTALGTDFMDYYGDTHDFLFKVLTGAGWSEFHASSGNRPDRAFVGFISDAPINGIYISSSGGGPFIDNFTYGSKAPAVVPEPATLALLGLGLLGVHLTRRKAQGATRGRMGFAIAQPILRALVKPR